MSGLEKFEGPDPAYWCARGYAVCNPDVRGVVDSDGDSVLWDRQEGLLSSPPTWWRSIRGKASATSTATS